MLAADRGAGKELELMLQFLPEDGEVKHLRADFKQHESEQIEQQRQRRLAAQESAIGRNRTLYLILKPEGVPIEIAARYFQRQQIGHARRTPKLAAPLEAPL